MALIDARRLMSGPRWTITAILVGNLIPVAGVLFLGWDAAQILMLYWVENVVVGLLTLPRILAAQRLSTGASGGRLGQAISTGVFFVVHYGVFCMGHLVFAMALAADFVAAEGGDGEVWDRTFGDPAFLWAILAMAALQLISQVRGWWMAGAWRETSPTLEMFKPYGRIFVLHLTVLFGAWLLLVFKAPAWAVLILCLGKAGLELVGAVLTGRIDPRRL
jgi:hypothetical protein